MLSHTIHMAPLCTHSKRIQKNHFVLVDAGAEYFGYSSDITRTFPADGKFSDHQKLIYEMVLNVSDTAEAMLGPGVKWSDITKKAAFLICFHLLNGGFLTGSMEDLMKSGVYSIFYPHGLGHFIGLDVHDTTTFPSILEQNMVLTIEPGIYFNRAFVQNGYQNPYESKFLVKERINKFLDMNFGGVRIEDDLIITKTGAELISHVPKTVHEIEAIMNH